MKDTRNMIIGCAEHLIFEEKTKKITVKMIVDLSNVTRQTFYYHFTDIPDLFSHIMKKRTNDLLEKTSSIEDGEARLKYFLNYSIETKDSIERIMDLNYGEEFKKSLSVVIYDFFKQSFNQNDIFKTYSSEQQELFIQYHASAIMHMISISNMDSDIDMLARSIEQIIERSLI